MQFFWNIRLVKPSGICWIIKEFHYHLFSIRILIIIMTYRTCYQISTFLIFVEFLQISSRVTKKNSDQNFHCHNAVPNISLELEFRSKLQITLLKEIERKRKEKIEKENSTKFHTVQNWQWWWSGFRTSLSKSAWSIKQPIYSWKVKRDHPFSFYSSH